MNEKSYRRYFLGLVFSLCLALVAGLYSLEAFHRIYPFSPKELIEHHLELARQSPPRPILALGDSHSAFALNLPDPLFFNFSYGADCSVKIYAKLRHQLQSHWRPQYILLSADLLTTSGHIFYPHEYSYYSTLFTEEDRQEIKALVPDYVKSTDDLFSSQAFKEVQLHKMNLNGRLRTSFISFFGLNHLNYDEMKYLLPNLWRSLTGERNFVQNRKNGSSFRREKSLQADTPQELEAKSKKFATEIFTADNKRANKVLTHYFFKTIQLARQHQIQVVLIHNPFIAQFLTAIPTEQKENFRQLIKVATAIPGVRFWDFSQAIKESKLFYDIHHLNQLGARPYSQLVLQKIQAELPLELPSPVLGQRTLSTRR